MPKKVKFVILWKGKKKKKKIAIIFAIVLCILGILINSKVFATNVTNVSNEQSKTITQLVEMKDNEKKTLEDYQQAYGSDSYGLTAYVLSKIQVYSIPFCFLGIAISAIYQYVLGIRKLDTRDKGFAIMISIITLFVIAQVLPLIFAIVVRGWRD